MVKSNVNVVEDAVNALIASSKRHDVLDVLGGSSTGYSAS